MGAALYNFSAANLVKWKAALANVKAGTGNAKLACVGDSTTVGYGSAGNGYVGARAASYPSFLGRLLSTCYMAAQADSFFGNANSGNGVSDYSAYDSRVTLGTGWSIFTDVPNLTAGGHLFGSGTATTPLAFNPGVSCDTFDIYYLRNSAFSVNVNGGPALASVSAEATNDVVKLTVSCPLGSNVLNIVPTGTTPTYIVGAVARTSAQKKIEVYGMGSGGAKAADWADASYPWTARNAMGVIASDLSVITLGINDWNATTSAWDFIASIQSILDTALLSGSAILVVPPPSSPTLSLRARQNTLRDSLYALSDQNSVPLIDFMDRWGEFSTANADGFYADGLDHPSADGYFDIASVIANAITTA